MSIRLRTEIRCSWIAVLGPIVAALFTIGFVAFHLTEWPSPAIRQTGRIDPLFFQHTGWYVLQGGVPYVDVWDVNPPVPFAITAALAALSGGDMLLLHRLSVALTVFIAASSILLVGWVAYRVTGEDVAAVAAGFVMLVVPELFVAPLLGVRAQFYALFFGVLALALALRDRPFLAGAVGALSAGSWQAGGAFALVVVGIAYQRIGRNGALAAVAGSGAVAGSIGLAFAAVGAFIPMIVETVLAPLIAGSPYSLTEHIYSTLLVFGYGAVLLLVAFYGWTYAVARELRELWWIPAGGLLLGFQVLFVDMDGATDAFLWLVFVAFGVAIAAERVIAVWTAPSNPRPWTIVAVIIVVGLLVLSGLVWNVRSPFPVSTLQTMEEDANPDKDLPLTPADGDPPSIHTIYWEQMEPDVCHYRLSWNEVRWIVMTDDRLNARNCGAWPSRIDRG